MFSRIFAVFNFQITGPPQLQLSAGWGATANLQVQSSLRAHWWAGAGWDVAVCWVFRRLNIQHTSRLAALKKESVRNCESDRETGNGERAVLR
jgi:hypothetical protein